MKFGVERPNLKVIVGVDHSIQPSVGRKPMKNTGNTLGNSTVFKTMTADNGPEFITFSKFESLGTKVYFAHPYSYWEHPQNERHNGLLREFIPKGTSIEQYTDDDILDMADTLNQRPRRILDYHSPAELFEAFLDEVYAIDNIS